jgi:hypothetical protein
MPSATIDSQKLNLRLKEMFKERIAAFREAVYLLSGYKVKKTVHLNLRIVHASIMEQLGTHYGYPHCTRPALSLSLGGFAGGRCRGWRGGLKTSTAINVRRTS